MIRRLAKVLQVCRHARLQAKLLQKLFSEINFFGGETFATKLFACLVTTSVVTFTRFDFWCVNCSDRHGVDYTVSIRVVHKTERFLFVKGI